MLLLIDNYDSFVFNIYQYVLEQTSDIKVIRNDALSLEEIKALNPSKIIISPGPKDPDNAGISKEIIDYYYKKVPILGICLGHQCISEVFGQKVVVANKIRHGKVSTIQIVQQHPIFNGINRKITVVRYHSLVIPNTTKKLKDFQILAYSEDDKEIMAIAHNDFPLIGLQFHPESILTQDGKKMIGNFLTI